MGGFRSLRADIQISQTSHFLWVIPFLRERKSYAFILKIRVIIKTKRGDCGGMV